MSAGAFEVIEVAPRPLAVMRSETKWDELPSGRVARGIAVVLQP